MKLYVFVNSCLAGPHKAVQAMHAVAELSLSHREVYENWAIHHKHILFKEGGVGQVFLDRLKLLTSYLPSYIPINFFYDKDLILTTAASILVPNDINRDFTCSLDTSRALDLLELLVSHKTPLVSGQ